MNLDIKMKKKTLEKRLEVAMKFINELAFYDKNSYGNPYENDPENRGIAAAHEDIGSDAAYVIQEIENIVD